jgi:hypothetical protein
MDLGTYERLISSEGAARRFDCWLVLGRHFYPTRGIPASVEHSLGKRPSIRA